MKFLKIHPQRALNVDDISSLVITGQEGSVRMEAELKSGLENPVLAHFGDFRSAEIRLMELVDELEAMP